MAKKQCPLCKKVVEEKVLNVCAEAQAYVIERIKKDHPEWIEANGTCPRCIKRYEKL